MSKYDERYNDILRDDAVDMDLTQKVICAGQFFDLIQPMMKSTAEDLRALGAHSYAELMENDLSLVRILLCKCPAIGDAPEQN